jgi:hypothetical protein
MPRIGATKNIGHGPQRPTGASFLSENIFPLQQSGQLKFAADNSREVHPAIELKTACGHTESMFTPHIQYKGQTIVYCADLIPSMAHLPMPYVMAYDTRPLLTLTEKQTLLTEAVANNYLLFFEHDPTNELCTLQNTDRGVREKEVMKMREV